MGVDAEGGPGNGEVKRFPVGVAGGTGGLGGDGASL